MFVAVFTDVLALFALALSDERFVVVVLITLPLACRLLAVITSITSISFTVAALIKISFL